MEEGVDVPLLWTSQLVHIFYLISSQQYSHSVIGHLSKSDFEENLIQLNYMVISGGIMLDFSSEVEFFP
jgi:hypothetical protein